MIDIANGPAWVRSCDRAFSGEKKNYFCGVSSVYDAVDPSLAMTGAETRAKGDLARKIETALVSGVKSWQSEVRNGVSQKGTSESFLEAATKEVARRTMKEIRVFDSYVPASGKGIWVMVYMDKAVLNGMDSMKELDEHSRQDIVNRAEKAFAEMDRDADKKGLPPIDDK